MFERIFDGTGVSTIRRDVQSGRAGFLPRLVLSAAAAGILAIVLFMLGVLDHSSHVQEAHIALGLGMGGVAWCAALIWLWRRYRRFGRILLTAFFIIAIWLIVIPVSIWIDGVTPSQEFLIAGMVFLGIAGTFTVACVGFYDLRRGKKMIAAGGEIDVRCPNCGYSLVGLNACICPECGGRFTIDEVIRLQEYEPRPADDRAPAGAEIRDARTVRTGANQTAEPAPSEGNVASTAGT